jgi:transposase-like protein
VISYELYSQIRLLHQERGLNFAQIARELDLDEETVAKWARAKNYTKARCQAPERNYFPLETPSRATGVDQKLPTGRPNKQKSQSQKY